jgi:hypothetical protein
VAGRRRLSRFPHERNRMRSHASAPDQGHHMRESCMAALGPGSLRGIFTARRKRMQGEQGTRGATDGEHKAAGLGRAVAAPVLDAQVAGRAGRAAAVPA